MRPDLQHRPGLRRPAGQTPGHGRAHAAVRRGWRRYPGRGITAQLQRSDPRHSFAYPRSGRSHRRSTALSWLWRTGDRRATRERDCVMDDFTRTTSREYAGGKMLAAKENGVGVVTFNQPEKHNAMSVEMWLGLAEILDDFREDASVRTVIMTGAGKRA